MNIAVIPARGGSKRIPRKNVRPFCGKPMLAYAIEAAKTSGLFEHIVVSTDDEEIAGIAHEYNAEIPFIRPKELADDLTPTVPVIAHAIQECQKFGWAIEYVCCIYPGVPFIQIEDLRQAYEQLIASNADYCFPVAKFTSAPQRGLRSNANGKMTPLYPEFELTRTQDLEPVYFDAGQFYWGKAVAWLHNHKLHSGGLGLKIPNWRVVDIDTMDDWVRAESIYRALVSS